MLTTTGFVARPECWVAAGNQVDDSSSSLTAVTDHLCRVLADSWGAWGKDDIGEAFGNGADGKPGFGSAADNLLTALAQMVNLLAQTGWGMQVSGATYAAADAASTIGGQPAAGPWRVARPPSYRLPAVSREIVPSDSPPAMWMNILEMLSSTVVGCDYPDGNFGVLGNISAELRAAANGITAIVHTVRRAARSVSSANSGQAADTFAAHARSIIAGLEWLASQCEALASSADNLLAQKHAARIEFWTSLAFLAVMFAAAQALAVFSFGASEGGFLAAVVGQGIGLRAMLIFVLRMVIEGMIFSAGDDVIDQFAKMHEHLQDGFDEGEFFRSAGTGGVASLVTFGLVRGLHLGAGSSKALQTVVGWMENDATASLSVRARGVFTRIAVNTVAGTGGNVAAQAAVDQKVDLKSAVGTALSMGIIGEGTEAGTRAAISYRIARFTADDRGGEGETAAAGPPPSAEPPRHGGVQAALATTFHDSVAEGTSPPTPDASPADASTASPSTASPSTAGQSTAGLPTAETGTEGLAAAGSHADPASPATAPADRFSASVPGHMTADVHGDPVPYVAHPGGHNDPLPGSVPASGHSDPIPAAAGADDRPGSGVADSLAGTQAPGPLPASAHELGAPGPDGHAVPASHDVWQAAPVGVGGGTDITASNASGAHLADVATLHPADGVGAPLREPGSYDVASTGDQAASGTGQSASDAGRADLTWAREHPVPDHDAGRGEAAAGTDPVRAEAAARPDRARADADDDGARSGQAPAGTHDAAATGDTRTQQQPLVVAVAPERVEVNEVVRIKVRNPELTYGAEKLGWHWGKALLDGKELPLMPADGKVSPYQFKQGAEGDCGYLSLALEAFRFLDKHDPQAIEQMFTHYPDEGKVIARIYDSKITWYGTKEWLVSEPTGRLYELEMTDEVVIQSDSADPGRPAFVDVRHAKALFVGMMEKAIAAADQTPTLFRPEDRTQGSGHHGDTGYKLLDGSEGSDWPAVLTMFTGRRARTFSDAETKDPVAFMQTVQAVRQADLPVVGGTRGSYGDPAQRATMAEAPSNLYWHHAYGIFSIVSKLHGGVDGGYLNAHNPHGGSDAVGTKGYTEPIPAGENPWELAAKRLQAGADRGHPITPNPPDGPDVPLKKGFPEPVPIDKDLWKVFNVKHWAALDFGTDPVSIENHALDTALRQGGAADLSPAPEVPAAARQSLRAAETAAAGHGERPIPDASRVAGNLAGILQAHAPDGAALLARLHEAGGDPVTAQRVQAAYAGLTGRDLATDIGHADVGFDPGGHLAHLLPDGGTAVPARPGDGAHSPEFVADLHDAISARDAVTASALLDQAGGKPRELWSLDDRYQEAYGTGVSHHIDAVFGDSAEGGYLRYLAGDDRLAAPAASPAEAWDMFRRLQQSTFTTSDGFEEPMPLVHTEGAADRAHRMALALTEWGHRPGKIFAIKNGLDLHPETPFEALNRLVPANMSYNAAPVIKVTGDDGHDLDIVLDPATADRPLTVDEWLGQMGVTRSDYLRFDASGLDDSARADIEGTLTDFFFARAQGRRYSNRALVYTTDPATYYPFAAARQLGLGQHLGERELTDLQREYGIPGTGGIVRRPDLDFARLMQDHPFRPASLKDADRQSASAQGQIESTIFRDAAERLRLRLWAILKSGANGQNATDEAVRVLNEDPQFAIVRRDLESGHSLPSWITRYVDGSSGREVLALDKLVHDINARFAPD